MNPFDQLERQRKSAMTAMIISFCMLGVGFILFFPLPPLGFALFAGGIVAAIFTTWRKIGPYRRAYKEVLVRGLLAERIDDLRFSPEEGIDKDIIDATDMMILGNRYSSNDLIEGNYQGVRFRQSDVLIQNHTSNGKSSSTITYFKGRWMIFDFNKRFHCDLQVRDRDFDYAQKSGGWFSDRAKTEKLETESVEFNRIFKVYAQNDSEAFYILTPHFMEALLQVKATVDGDVLFCFVDHKLHVAIHNSKDGFEPSVWTPIDRAAATRAVNADIDLITGIVDTLNLDERLFMAE